ncbi:MAG TPA: ATP-binding protein, partial [Xanthomonadales bacterium]|nr:ATP-binding protein [Xanthomonadales bacterium]
WRQRTNDGAWLPFEGELRRTFAAGVTRIEFQALDGQGRASAVSRVQLRVAPLWHETAFAHGLAALALLLLLVLSAATYGRWRTRKLERERARLEQLVAERTADVRRQADEIRLLSDARTRFFANVSHEFRTPLTLVLGPLGDALEGRFGALPSTLKAALETARSSARRLLRLVGELLDLSRLAAGRFDLRVAEHDLAEQLRREIEAFARQARSRDIDLAGEGLADPLLLWYDADQLERMLSNLLSNALKFTPNGGRVRLRVVPTATEVGIEVEDNGPGIAPPDHARVFERFYQGSSVGTLDAPGTGIGLALVRELIDLHHGRAELISEPGQGSCFVLWLRRGKAHFLPDQLVDALPGVIPATVDQASSDDEMLAPAQAGDVLRPTLLVVDDHDQLRRYLADRLGDAYQVLTARNGDEALASINESLPDVVVSDVMMPGIDGIALARQLRRNPETAGVPLLLLSARAHKRDIVDGLDAGADDYLTKPFDTSELIARIEALLETRRRLRTQIEQELGSAPRPSAESVDDGTPTPIESAHQRFGERLQQTLERQLGDPQFGVAELAATLHVDRATLFRRTKASYQCTPSELLRERRLQRAHALLTGRRGSVSEVAYAAGFDNLSHFSQAFRKRFGVAPSSLL